MLSNAYAVPTLSFSIFLHALAILLLEMLPVQNILKQLMLLIVEQIAPKTLEITKGPLLKSLRVHSLQKVMK
jgi:hypothetical protein